MIFTRSINSSLLIGNEILFLSLLNFYPSLFIQTRRFRIRNDFIFHRFNLNQIYQNERYSNLRNQCSTPKLLLLLLLLLQRVSFTSLPSLPFRCRDNGTRLRSITRSASVDSRSSLPYLSHPREIGG